MAREKVEKIQCDRCKRAELRTLSATTPDVRPPDFEASFMGKKLLYPDLCEKCRETIDNIWKDLEEWDREVKYTTIRTTLLTHPDQAPPLSTAPNFTPVQPHSAAAAKR